MKNFRTTHVFIKETEDMHDLNVLLKQGFNMMLYNVLSSALDNLLSKNVIQGPVLYFCFWNYFKLREFNGL